MAAQIVGKNQRARPIAGGGVRLCEAYSRHAPSHLEQSTDNFPAQSDVQRQLPTDLAVVLSVEAVIAPEVAEIVRSHRAAGAGISAQQETGEAMAGLVDEPRERGLVRRECEIAR